MAEKKLIWDWDSFWEADYKNVSAEAAFNARSHQGRITLEVLNKRKSGARILEAGCGIGTWVFWFDRLGFDSYGIDISFASLHRAVTYSQEEGSRRGFLQGDIKQLPFRNEIFDVVVSYGAVEHFPDTENALRDFLRVLKPEGVCLVTTPNPFSFHRLIGRHILNITKSRKLGYVGYENAFTPRQLAQKLKNVGFPKVEYGILSNGMGHLLGEFWPAMPMIGKHIFNLSLKVAHFIEARQNTIGGGSFAIGYKRGS